MVNIFSSEPVFKKIGWTERTTLCHLACSAQGHLAEIQTADVRATIRNK